MKTGRKINKYHKTVNERSIFTKTTIATIYHLQIFNFYALTDCSNVSNSSINRKMSQFSVSDENSACFLTRAMTGFTAIRTEPRIRPICSGVSFKSVKRIWAETKISKLVKTAKQVTWSFSQSWNKRISRTILELWKWWLCNWMDGLQKF